MLYEVTDEELLELTPYQSLIMGGNAQCKTCGADLEPSMVRTWHFTSESCFERRAAMPQREAHV